MDNKFLEKIKRLIIEQENLSDIIIQNSDTDDNKSNVISLLEDMKKRYKEINNIIEERIQLNQNTSVIHEGNLNKFKELSMSLTDKRGIHLGNPINAFKNKQQIKFFEKNYKDLIEILEINLSVDNLEIFNHDMEKIDKNIENDLNKIKFIQKNNTYENDFLNNIDDDSKLQTIYTILWPTMHKKIKQAYHSLQLLQQIVKSNKTLSLVFDFSEKNNFDPDDVINILMQDNNACDYIFSEQKGIDKIKNNYKEIIHNINAFTINTNKITNYLTVLFKVVEDMKKVIKELNVSNDDKEQLLDSIDQSIVWAKENSEVTYSTLHNKMNKLNDKVIVEKNKLKL